MSDFSSCQVQTKFCLSKWSSHCVVHSRWLAALCCCCQIKLCDKLATEGSRDRTFHLPTMFGHKKPRAHGKQQKHWKNIPSANSKIDIWQKQVVKFTQNHWFPSFLNLMKAMDLLPPKYSHKHACSKQNVLYLLRFVCLIHDIHKVLLKLEFWKTSLLT